LFIARYKNIEKLERITAEQFLIKIAGKQGWEKVWKPMLRIKFGDNYNKIPAVWIWERIVQRFRSRTSSGKDEVLGYMDGSFHLFSQRLLQSIRDKDAKVYLKTEVNEIIIEDGKCKGIRIGSETKIYDFVFCTASLPVFVDLCKNAESDYIGPFKKVNYDSVMVVMMILDKPLSDIYWMNISDGEIPFGGLIEHTNFIPKENYGDKVVLYFSKYLNANDEYMNMSKEKLIEKYITCLEKIYPKFDRKIIKRHYIFKDRYAQPIWPLQYSEIKPAYKTPIDGLYLSNTSQIYPNDRGINFSIKLGKEVVEAFIGNGTKL
jgi:protoporphyrinogen oxidase